MSRRMPPTPVAAPWYGSTARRVVVRFDLERDGQPVADRDDAGVLAGPGDDALALPVGSVRSSGLRALVRAVLAPHDAEHRELEVVRVAARAGRGSRRARRRSARARDAAAPRRGGHGAARPSIIAAAPRPRRRRLGARAARVPRLDERAEDRQAVVGAEQAIGGPLRVRHQAGDVARARSSRRRSPAGLPFGFAGSPSVAGRACRPRGRSGRGPGRRARAASSVASSAK